MITLKQIEAAHWVEKLGSFHAAASRLNTTQSTISKRILELELTLGFELFDRSTKTTQVTLRGRGVLDDFAEMLKLRHKIEHSSTTDGGYSGYFYLGATEMVAITWLPKLIRAITARFPNLKLRTSVQMAHQLQPGLAAYKFDLIICPMSFDGKMDELRSLPLDDLQSRWMINPDLPEARSGLLTASELACLPLLTYAEGSLLHQVVVKALSENGLRARQTIGCSSMIAIAELVRGGLGVAYLPHDYFAKYRGGLKALETELEIPPLPYGAIFRDDFVAAQIAQLAEDCCDFSGGLD
ncbi:MAG: LysR family transcriptional regulator [Jhaorihella sp.]